MRARRLSRLGVALALVLALAACTGIPTYGPVRPGDGGVATPGPVLPVLQGPQPGDDARAILQGFLIASAGGAISGFDIAREFLTAEASLEWEPMQQVIIFDSRQVAIKVDDESRLFTYSLPVAAVLDEHGVLTETEPEVRQDIEFTLTRTETGEYRISQLDDGIIISEANFVRYFRPVSLAFASPDLTVVVPEVRYLANNDQIATAAARELIQGPSAWLADAVVTGFPPTSSLAVEAVVVENGLAQVSLAAGSAGSAQERALAAEQMDLTLLQLSTVTSVNTTVGGVGLTIAETRQLQPAPLPEQAAAVIADGRLGLWDGFAVTVTPDAWGALPTQARDLALSYDVGRVAWADEDGVWVSDAVASREQFIEHTAGMEAPPDLLAAELLMPGEQMVGPSFDRFGWLWTTPAEASGFISVAAPWVDETSVSELAADWLLGRTVDAVSVSRDGARLAVLSRLSDEAVLEIAAIVRDSEGRPLSLGVPLALAPSLRLSGQLVWVDTVSVAMLGDAAGDIAVASVGGRTSDVSALSEATALSVRYGDRSLVAVTDSHELQVRSGNRWVPRWAGIWDVAYPG